MATEKKLISLDEAIARIKDDGILGYGYSDDERMDDVIDMLESCHIVDAVEVVRCKDCKHCKYQDEDDDRGDCDIHDTWTTRTPESFCCHGERRPNDH